MSRRGSVARSEFVDSSKEKLLGPKDRAFALQIAKRLKTFDTEVLALPGAPDEAHRTTLAFQIVEGVRRERYVRLIRARTWSADFADPESAHFDPLKGAIYHYELGNIDEAFWLVFLSVHFGKHLKDGWQLVRDIYRGDGGQVRWSWAKVANSPASFRKWLAENQMRLRDDGVKRRFGNHRKYETLRVNSARGTAEVFKSYVDWIGANRGHALFFSQVAGKPPISGAALFDVLYNSLDAVVSFGRTAKFDFLGMITKIGFLPICPGIPYLEGATGPLRGARLLFGNDIKSKKSTDVLTPHVVELGNFLKVSMQVMEDALCNWQKSPAEFLPFRG
jgi:hypothetical protein